MGTCAGSTLGLPAELAAEAGPEQDDDQRRDPRGATEIACDVLVIGGGTAGPMAAYKAS